MGGTIIISVGVSLVALAAGAFLLAKANRENYGLWYKIIAWFIIVASFLNMGCAAMHSAMKFYGRHYMHHEKKMYKKMKMYGGWEKGMGHGMRYESEKMCDPAMCQQGDHWKKCYMSLRDSCEKIKK